ncbi:MULTISPECIES: STAS domain-containing protein [unclassified Streptomyces]|uniref:STAS domain-containing protein n=1 Tax=unclassified Streptomyces TaxID=2593676 RepID=UPI000BFC8502|nr:MULTISPECIES: STAS domain-containing protein [unclassified Streptomyces]PVD02346.1 anti-sigma factor antagonist [Streptomyces sp. CS147]
MVSSLQLDTQVAPGCTTLVISGECDQDDVQVLERALAVVVEDSPPVLIVDVSRLLFGDSVLLHFLLSAQRAQTASGGRLEVRGPLAPAVERLLRETGTYEAFTVTGAGGAA